MMNNPTPITEYIRPGRRAHLVGIGGVSMCPLAEVLKGMGLEGYVEAIRTLERHVGGQE